VAPPENQAVNEENKSHREKPVYLDSKAIMTWLD
jgi:hypothetical protein